jgi:hypothetical protein
MFATPDAFEKFLAERFTRIRSVQRLPTIEPAGPARAAGLELATEERVRRLVPDPVGEADVAARIARALAAGVSLGGDLDSLVTAVRRLARLRSPEMLLHGTGSWALAGILRCGAIVPGGDGLTGEVAMTNVVEPDVFVIEWRSSLAFYGAAAFAYMNAAWTEGRGEAALWSPRLGHARLEDFFSILLFDDADPNELNARDRPEPRYWRVRDPAADAVTRMALERLVDLARADALPEDVGRRHRELGAISPEVAENNVLYAILELAGREPELRSLPSAARMKLAVLRYAPRLRALLCCALPEDNEEARRRKEAFIEQSRQQFPVVMALDSLGLSPREDPTYPWSPERRVHGRIPLERVRHVWVPEGRRLEVADALVASEGTGVQVHPLEDFALLRVIAEAPVTR